MIRRIESQLGRFPWSKARADALTILTFLVLLAPVMWHRFTYDNWLIDFDILTFFLPRYGVLGDRLSHFDIPGWTRYFSSGAPLAGDPSSGWMYVPAMITFTFFERELAFKMMVLLQTLIGGFGIYVLGRRLGFRPLAALLSTVAFSFGPFLYGQTAFATVAGQVTTWIPVGLLSVEMSLRADRWHSRIAWSSITGFAISQMAVAWPGQGMVNGILVVVGWFAYRSAILLVTSNTAGSRRLVETFVTAGATLVFGFTLSAAGMLPRLSVNQESSLAGGDYSRVVGGDYEAHRHSILTFLSETLSDDMFFRPVAISGVILTLSILAAMLTRSRFGVPYFVGVLVVASILAFPETIIHRVFYSIPMFETIHEHSPRRFLWIVSFAPAMLAGAAAQTLSERSLRTWVTPLLAVPFGVIALAQIYVLNHGLVHVGAWLVGAALLATELVLIAALGSLQQLKSHAEALTRGAIVGLIATVFIVPTGRDILHTLRDPTAQNSTEVREDPSRRLHSDPFTQATLATYLDTTGERTAAEFLQNQRDSGPPFRYAGYAGRFFSDPRSYSSRRLDGRVVPILVNGRSGTLELEGMQSYNPMNLRYYVEYNEAMNRGQQDYHWLDPFPAALSSSPLLDMLNVRYIVVSRSIPPNSPDYRWNRACPHNCLPGCGCHRLRKPSGLRPRLDRPRCSACVRR